MAYQLPINTLLAGCQYAPHPCKVNEIRCKCRYNGAFLRRTNYTVSTLLPNCRNCQLVNKSESLRSVWVCWCVCMSWGNQVISQTHLPSGSPAACPFICSPFWLLTTHLMPPLQKSCRLICPPLAAPPPLLLGSTIWVGKSLCTQAGEQAQSHTQMRWFRWLALLQLLGP